jgi:hypothetical protein
VFWLLCQHFNNKNDIIIIIIIIIITRRGSIFNGGLNNVLPLTRYYSGCHIKKHKSSEACDMWEQACIEDFLTKCEENSLFGKRSRREDILVN